MMNARSYSGGLARWLIIAAAAPAVVFLVTMVGRTALAQETQESPADQLAEQRELRVPPVAAGRNKAALIDEAGLGRPTTATQPAIDMSKVDCASCHECKNPTKDNPCLRMCPRSVGQVIAAATHEQLPNVILLNAFEWQDRRFMPVPFPHKLHADMAGIAGGCQVCHHHTTEGKIHPPCRDCHKPVFAKSPGEEMRMPSLKGAYHRQCMGCHRDWSHATRCSVCHLPKGNQPRPARVEEVPPGDIAGHPPIENPALIVRETDYAEGPHVVFRHQDHIKLYGYECARCHKGQSCSRCHEEARAETRPATSLTREERHGACFPCHEDDSANAAIPRQ